MNAPEIRQALDTLAAQMATDPAKARAKNASAVARLSAGLQCEVTGPHGARLTTDMPPAMGGAASAPNPGWLFRGSLAACTATVIAMRAAKLGVTLSALEVTVESESDNRGMLGLDETISAGLRNLRTKVRIAGDAPAQTLREIAAWGDSHSPIGCTLRNAQPSSLEVELVPA
jgi:uncharacterized OsmC-like protein